MSALTRTHGPGGLGRELKEGDTTMTREEATRIVTQGEPPSAGSLPKSATLEEYQMASRKQREWATAQEILRDGGKRMATAARERRLNGCGCDNAPDCLCSF